MAEFTIELRDIASTASELFNFDYDFYVDDSTIREKFQQKFYDRYYLDEIAFETIATFKHYLRTTLNEIMPRYEHLYETTQYEYDPLKNYDVDETINMSGNNSATGTGENINYDTPVNPKSNYEQTPSFISENETSSTQDTTSSTTRKTEGNIGVQTSQDLIQKERSIIENIDERLIKELSNLFMGVYN